MADRRQDVAAIGEYRARLGDVAIAQIFQHDRKVIGQFASRELEPCPLVYLPQFDHRRTAITPFAVEVLEEMQRQASAAVEEVDIALLGRQQIALADLVDQVE